MTDFLIFTEIPTVGKTKRFDVRSVHTDESLGTITEQDDGQIHWRNGWRRYVMHFERDCDWSVECMAQCYKFIAKLMQERRTRIIQTDEDCPKCHSNAGYSLHNNDHYYCAVCGYRENL